MVVSPGIVFLGVVVPGVVVPGVVVLSPSPYTYTPEMLVFGVRSIVKVICKYLLIDTRRG